MRHIAAAGSTARVIPVLHAWMGECQVASHALLVLWPQEQPSLMEVFRIHRWQDQVNWGLQPSCQLVILCCCCFEYLPLPLVSARDCVNYGSTCDCVSCCSSPSRPGCSLLAVAQEQCCSQHGKHSAVQSRRLATGTASTTISLSW